MLTNVGNVGMVTPQVLDQNAMEEKGEMARLSAFVGAIAVSELVRSTLGPRGMDKILQPQSTEGGNEKMIITNDGATILKNVYFSHSVNSQFLCYLISI